MAAQHTLQCLGAALVGHMVELYAGHARKLLHAHMRGTAHACMGIGHLAGPRLGGGHEVLERLERRMGGHGNAEGLARGARDVGVVLARIGLQAAQLRKARDRDGNLADGVAVRPGRGQRLGADHSRGARAVLHRDRLAQQLAGHGAQRAHGLVGRAARRPGADEGDGAFGPVLGEKTSGGGQCAGAERGEHEFAPACMACAWGVHRLSPVLAFAAL